MTRVGIYTHDFKFYHDIIKELKRWNLPFFSIPDLYSIPGDINVILSSEQDPFTLPGQIKAVTATEGIRRSLPVLLNKSQFTRVIIGIDPGPRPGIAVMSDNVLMEAWECPTICGVKDDVLDVVKNYSYRYIMIKIGNGDRPNRDIIIKQLKNIAPMVIVNEENTSTPHKIHDNALSAARISLIDDRYDTSRTPVKFSRKNIYDKEFITLHSLI
ncbi:hypothetical protein [Ferroplasma acidarmanus]|uniref:DUF460 domain-containing protein n=1 Tax=Ferroplasma acidarmanus Fer1 TaxID=333146 RepID=S0APJ4_FERAC|nr:hypothetical protein [Ferroplasma acidarmanus]AGO61193.1 hypothetical protein FACI_IFERC00001G1213 [Ferroplasma acidarmanus Fer1]